MGSEYDRKFEEMKKYIPFLESMITRLENNNSLASNPRQAQLDKIRSLRDLLLDQKKRMKMDNLLKCEQVLVNLYAKVEQKDTLPVVKVEATDFHKDGSDLESVRNKLKTVAKIQNIAETLPEIARASEREGICEPGSKEPALFQRRPNRSSLSPLMFSPNKSHESKVSPKQQSRRSYTRVLVSPEPRPVRWAGSEPTEKPLFSRRSPKKSPRRTSPPYKKEKKKSSKSNERKSRKDLNITLKVPEESLNSLNTEDILSRIINCSDGDVDITTLRELRSQILGELKQTGKNDDISELILKSYNKKPKSKKKNKPEVEEGEISDSESEVIENVYGSLVVMDKDKKSGQVKTSEQSNQQRKIQICLVINSDKEAENKPEADIDLSESGVFESKNKNMVCVDSDTSPDKKKDTTGEETSLNQPQIGDLPESNEYGNTIKTEKSDSKSNDVAEGGNENDSTVTSDSSTKDNFAPNKSQVIPTKTPSESLESPSPTPAKLQENSNETTKNIANFYTPNSEKVDRTDGIEKDKISEHSLKSDVLKTTTPTVSTEEQISVERTNDTTEIPLLNEPTLPPKAKKDVLSEIDILQALKNEILSETISIAATETDTPALHQPKISKIASALEAASALPSKATIADKSIVMPKKRISIENYKNKSYKSLFIKKRSNAKRKETKKQSLKLTEKECERFNLSTRLSLDDDTDNISDDDLLDDDDDEKNWSMRDIYKGLAPKSPDQDFSEDISIAAPVMIPVEPVKTTPAISTIDVDLRSIPTPVPAPAGHAPMVVPAVAKNEGKSPSVFELSKTIPDGNRKALMDPRLRREQTTIQDSPNAYGAANLEGTPRPSQFPNIPPLLGQIFTPSYAPSMTPTRTASVRSYEMTPTRMPFDNEEPQSKHVYAPSFSMCESRERTDKPTWEPNLTDENRSRHDARNPRWELSRDSTAHLDPQPSYNPRNDKFYIDQREGYNKPDCPATPGPFGWSDSPGTPRNSFALLETPRTPSHSFGMDCPTTPLPSFGRSDCPPTPSHSFGRECPSTPSHPFGRSEGPSTPNHPFGRHDNKDPRLRRQSDFEPRSQHDEGDHGYHNDRSFNRSNSYKSHGRSYSGSDSPRNFDREHHFGKNDRYYNEPSGRYSRSNVSDPPQRFDKERGVSRSSKSYLNESSDRGFDRARRDHGMNRALPKEDNSRLFTRNRDSRYDNRYSDHNEEVCTSHNVESNAGKAIPIDPMRARASSVSRNEYNNSLCVKPKSCRSFTIDTSVNATFQDLIESGKGIQVFDYTFDSRRQRAASVGRSLVRESSVNRSPSYNTKSKEAKSTDSARLRRRDNFQRASSVGRTLVSNNKEKTFQEIKADFESYRLSSSKVISKPAESKIDNQRVKKSAIESNLRSRKEDFETHGRGTKYDAKQPYSPRKNNRDPRIRTDPKEIRNSRNDRNSNSRDRRHSGISYSNDNIAKGTIMGTGFGVKNYKIPKIKRPEPERPKTPIEEVKEPEKAKKSAPNTETDKKTSDKKSKNKNSDVEIAENTKTLMGKKHSTEKSIEKKDKGAPDNAQKSKNKLLKSKDSKTSLIITSDEDSEKRVTRSSKKSDSNLKQESIKKLKRIRKAIIDDSDSGDEQDLKSLSITEKSQSLSKSNKSNEPKMLTEQKVNDTSNKTVQNPSKTILNKSSVEVVQPKQDEESVKSTAARELRKTLEDDSLDSSFGMDDLEMFSDNIVSDPVIDNINDLIADLDHDLSAAKPTNDNFTTEMEKIINSIDSHEENTLGDISELIEKDLNESKDKLQENVIHNKTEPTGQQDTVTSIVTKEVSQEQKSNLHDNINSSPKKISPTLVTKQPVEVEASCDKTVCEEKDSNNVMRASTDETVSTTQVDESSTNKDDSNICIKNATVPKNKSNDQSTPDSTIVQDDDVPNKIQESLPDSTMDIHSEVSSDVTSTLNDPEKGLKETVEPSQSRKEVSAIESFGSLLSILQDKSKIKEFLSMLGEQSGESEKIKKKLEKLSEIVSDDEDEIDQNKNTEMTDKTELGSETHDVEKSTDTQKEPETKSDDKHSTCVEVDETVKILDTEKGNTEQPEDQNDIQSVKTISELTQNTVLEAHINKNINEQSIDDRNNDLESNKNQSVQVDELIEQPTPKKTKITKRGKGKFKRGKANPKRINKMKELKLQKMTPKQQTPQKKTKNRELQTLQNDINEMFMRDDVLNATGIRMCRLAKLVDKKAVTDTSPKESEPMVLLEKFKSAENIEEPKKKARKKPGPKPKPKTVSDPDTVKKHDENQMDKPKTTTGHKPGPKSKTKQKHETSDPYEFDTDSVADTNTTKESDDNSTDSDNESLVSTESVGSTEVLADIKKKPKKKRGSWKTGVIKQKYKKKKEQESSSTPEGIKTQLPVKSIEIPDLNCFTDKMYCFQRNVNTYDCRLCHFSGTDIVNHYKKQHAHTEVPLSRMDPVTAQKAIQQCEEINFHDISKIPSYKYTCRFCYKEFSKTKVALETFFWHVVSTHTGEYKHLCYQCVNVTKCPFSLDIPPPPKDVKGQLIGYICGKCNFTQISLENLKTHVIVRHNDEQTEVYAVNLGVMSQKCMKSMIRKNLNEEQSPRTLRSSRSNQSAVEASDDRSEVSGSDLLSEIGSVVTKIEEPDPHIDDALAEVKRTPGPLKSKIRFETDDQDRSDETSVKLEIEHGAEYLTETSLLGNTYDTTPLKTHHETSGLNQTDEIVQLEQANESTLKHASVTAGSDDLSNANTSQDLDLEPTDDSQIPDHRRFTSVFETPHFKLNYKETGAKEYVCCVKGEENHYKTTLLISLKKHVQTKHFEIWDGYCCVCKVIVTLQGVQSSFRDCLTHFLDRHMDDFPVMEKAMDNTNEDSRSSIRSSVDTSTVERTESPRSYIAVRPLSDLLSKDVDVDPPVCEDSESVLPVIENIVSLGDKSVVVPQASPVYPTTSAVGVAKPDKPFQYEEVQAEVMSKKHRIVLDNMMPKELLVRVFKCAGRFCSFTSDSAEDSLVHASAHKQLGGEGALNCAYCNFDASGNAIDLVMHVFNEHGQCQYSCVQCFYRAAADQLVGAHFTKAHGSIGKAAKVIRTTSARASAAADSANMLLRETAVPHYICSYGGGSCKFRTYTPGKFCEHMTQKHGNEPCQCYMCEVTTPTATELVKHMKGHGVKLYQCTWCVHGANTEAEMLSHAASLHPTKNPQAYLRVITTKEGSTEFRVLPLIYLNKLKVPIEDVIPSKIRENPTREAERSIELEKLIRHTDRMLEPEPEDTSPSNAVPESPNEIEAPQEMIAEPSDSTDEQTVQAIQKSLLSSPQKPHEVVRTPVKDVEDKQNEALSFNQRLDNVVYCLDSEEDEPTILKNTQKNDPKQRVVDLSDDERASKTKLDTPILQRLVAEPTSKNITAQDKPKFIKLPPEVLFKCPNCEQNFRSAVTFKKHANVCCLELSTIRCPHSPCPIVLTNITQVINHYNKDHNIANVTKIFYCGICKSRWSTLNVTKKHLKDAHGVAKVIVTSKLEDDGSCSFTIHKELNSAGSVKRKASVETPKKFGIGDIDKLPINPILDSLVYCGICEFSTKVRINMVRHLQLHAERQPVPQTAPVNPVPHLESNEKHFDKMVNLASSSAVTRDKPSMVAAEASARFPKYVSERQRHTCGAKDCSYISVDEAMFRFHWETLHSSAVDYHCAHCPPDQHLDTSKPLSASRIIAHLKMHDVNLYACSSCSYYHYKKNIVEKHALEVHKDAGGSVLIVREEGTAPAQTPAAVGTMDLKPWQCGLCKFKSMLRRDLIEHCSEHHQTKMQYKCAYCPFRTSDVENIVKHQSNSHPSKAEDVFYYYYREGDVPNDADGTPRWIRQRDKCGIQDEVKSELEHHLTKPNTVQVDLNLVKKEADDNETEKSIEELCKIYGQFCDPNGISYKCSLCKTVMEFTREAMQSHLYEELKYRRWSCGVCTYKAYHKTGLNEHMASEHRSNFIEPSELPVNVNIEKWVAKLLDHQSAIIEGSKLNTQLNTPPKPRAGPSKVVKPLEPPKIAQSSDSELEQAFGSFGSPKDDSYSCPKCKMLIKDEDEMRNHLEIELTRIRWCCTKCTDKFQTFHEAQFHCKCHPGLLSRPKEAIRDPSLRSAWVSAVVSTQKKSMKLTTQEVTEEVDLDTSDNSLLLVRYEKAASTDEQVRQAARAKQFAEQTRKRAVTPDSDDDDTMVICEPESKKNKTDRNCPYCDFVSKSNSQVKTCMKRHILRHYNLRELTCSYCNFNASTKTMYHHLSTEHHGLPALYKNTDVPNCLPSEYELKSKNPPKTDEKDRKNDEDMPKVCLHCEATVPEDDLITHIHGSKPSVFAYKGEVVVKCCICLALKLDLQSMQTHYKEVHPDISNLNYAFYKLQVDTREVQSCGICKRRFTFLRDLRIHHSAMHSTFNITYNTVPYRADEDDHENRGKRKLEDVNAPNAKRIAKKSTSKLPCSSSVAKKSTSKLPTVEIESDSEDEYSFYGTKPSSFNQYENVKTIMPMCNTMVEIDVKKLSGILKIDPKVVVKDIQTKPSDT